MVDQQWEEMEESEEPVGVGVDSYRMQSTPESGAGGTRQGRSPTTEVTFKPIDRYGEEEMAGHVSEGYEGYPSEFDGGSAGSRDEGRGGGDLVTPGSPTRRSSLSMYLSTPHDGGGPAPHMIMSRQPTPISHMEERRVLGEAYTPRPPTPRLYTENPGGYQVTITDRLSLLESEVRQNLIPVWSTVDRVLRRLGPRRL